jgi:orotate phosphoribosyltransferase
MFQIVEGLMMDKLDLLKQLQDIGIIKYGDFILKSGAKSSIYIDLRELVAYPKLLNLVSQLMWQFAKNLQCDLVCGVPYNAIPLATCISINQNIPMLIKRKEVKEYGTKKQLEGKFLSGQTCLIIEDVITTGSSILETIDVLEKEKITVTDILVLVEREKSARDNLEKRGYQLHSVYTLDELLEKKQ